MAKIDFLLLPSKIPWWLFFTFKIVHWIDQWCLWVYVHIVLARPGCLFVSSVRCHLYLDWLASVTFSTLILTKWEVVWDRLWLRWEWGFIQQRGNQGQDVNMETNEMLKNYGWKSMDESLWKSMKVHEVDKKRLLDVLCYAIIRQIRLPLQGLMV